MTADAATSDHATFSIGKLMMNRPDSSNPRRKGWVGIATLSNCSLAHFTEMDRHQLLRLTSLAMNRSEPSVTKALALGQVLRAVASTDRLT